MNKRRLSKQQLQRIAKRQQKEFSGEGEESLPASGKRCNGRVVSHFGQQLDVESLLAEDRHSIVRCHQRTNLPPLVTGDFVVWTRDSEDDETGIILAQGERRNLFSRPDASGREKPVAANLDYVLVVFAVLPQAFMNLIDRYLVAIEALGLEPLLVLNKTDLIDDENREDIDNMLAIYEGLGYPVFRLSALEGSGISALEDRLNGKTAAVVGQSGVGKSSLINALGMAGLTATGELSQAKYKGTHHTTTARLFHLARCDLIDSPGIREFHLAPISQDQLLAGFKELRELAPQCKFRDCSHQSEPGCAVQAAVTAGSVAPERLESYFRILATLDNP